MKVELGSGQEGRSVKSMREIVDVTLKAVFEIWLKSHFYELITDHGKLNIVMQISNRYRDHRGQLFNIEKTALFIPFNKVRPNRRG